MTTKTIKIQELANWSEPKRVRTKHGPKDLLKATPGDAFWEAWKSAKQQLKDAGISLSKNEDGWEALWWRPISEQEQHELKQAREASRATDADIEIPSPEGLDYLPFQRAGIAYALTHQNTLIGDEMGLGKTIQGIGVWNSDPTIKRVLIVCPASLRLNWRNEFKKWATRPVRIEVIIGGKPDARPLDGWQVLIVNYDVLAKHKKWLEKFDFDLLIADECHYCKSPTAARTKALLGFTPRAGQKTKPEAPIRAKRKLFLSGTPILNRPVEVWPLIQAVDPSGLGRSFFKFALRYCGAKQNLYGWDFSGASNLDELQNLMRERFMVRRLKKDVLTELPPKQRQVIELPANGASKLVEKEKQTFASHREYIEALERRLAEAEQFEAAGLAHDDDIEFLRRELRGARQTAFSEMSKARKAVALAKVPKVVEHLLNALEQGPVVCFAHHIDVMDQIKVGIESEYRVATITGSTPLAARQEAVEKFQGGRLDLIIGNIQAAGVGLTLTRSSHVVFAELDWVPANLSQAEDRCHRISQTESVLVQHLVLEDSLDAEMSRKLIAKQEVIDQALDRNTDVDYGMLDTDEITFKVKEDRVAKQAASMTREQIEAVHHGLRWLAGMCDGARTRDDMGFNGCDTRFGKALASQDGLTARQAAIGLSMLHKYHRQLPEGLLDKAKKGETK